MTSSSYSVAGAPATIRRAFVAILVLHALDTCDSSTTIVCARCSLRRVYGAAFLVKDRADGLRYVVKHVSLDGLDEEDIESAVNEVAALHAMNHPNIVRCHGSWVMPASDDPSLRPWSAGTETTRLPVSEALAVWTAAQANDACVGSVPSLNILTEYVDGGALDKLILQNKGEKPLEEELVGIWLAQLALAIDHMHKNNLLHRDIKVGLRTPCQ